MQELGLDFTRQCNSKCTTCNIWKDKSQTTLGLKQIEDVLSSNEMKDCTNVYVTGGEPFLTDDIIQIGIMMRKYLPKAIMTGATNGIATKQILKRVNELKGMGMQMLLEVSFNGLPDTHNKTRGVKCYEQAFATLTGLKELGALAGIAYLRTLENTKGDDDFIVELAKRFQCGISTMEFELSGSRYHTDNKRVFKGWNFDCPALKRIVFINAYGDVLACEKDFVEVKLGNLYLMGFDEIMKRKQEVIDWIATKKCQPCDLICLRNKRLDQ